MEESLTYALLNMVMFLAVLGVVAGFLAGLLGIGGGAVLVPGLYFVFHTLGYPSALLMHLSIATSLSIIVPTGLSSARAHWKRGAVDFELVKLIGSGVIIGSFLGGFCAAFLSAFFLKLMFSVVIGALAILMFADPARVPLFSDVPGFPVPFFAGNFIGGVSSLIGIGGSTLSVPFMVLCKVPMPRAVGTASALGVLVSVPAVFGYVISGLGVVGRPELSIGFVSLPAFVVITTLSVLCAPLGACVAHRIPHKILRIGFAAFMVLVSLKMGMSLF